ncbi:hypothetical protein [Nonomuraea rhodomycinica]|uniref:Uncharacterized protein n=1 Tax=Nonomuraea rhodomycinica TaxID=1712872 RepID=A0A7Y6MG08_9ACTN|nr:hypothetical protein [Nonomuraea rhodomycinica]NUW45590.1 hypothetical protein [Nonomuraea rhodomycinica]
MTSIFEPAVRQFGPGEPPPLEDRDAVLDRLHRWMAQADEDADALAQRGGQERAIAAEHQRLAERYDEAAVEARKRADRWRRHIEIEMTEREQPAEEPVTRPVALPQRRALSES